MRSRQWTAGTHLILVVGLGALLVPLVWMVGSSLKAPDEVFSNILNPFPTNPTLANYIEVVREINLPRQFFNSMVFACGVTLGQLLMAIPAGYALARGNSRLFDALLAALLLTLSIPFVVVYVPNYIVLSKLDLLNTYSGLILPAIVNTYGAFGIFLLRQHFRSFPREIMEAARIDGCSDWGVLRRVVLPATRPAVVAVAVYVFIQSWNEYIWPLLVAPGHDMHVLTVGVANFATGEGGVEWGNVMAAATMATIPALLMYVILRRHVIAAFLEGAFK